MLKRKKLQVQSLESCELMKAPDEAPSLGPPPSPSSSVVWVDTVAERQSAVQNLVSNQTIVVEPGTYQLTRTLFVGKDRPVQNVTIRGSTDNFDDVVIKGLGMDGPFNAALAHGISVYNAQDVTIANLSVGEVYWHAVDLQGGAGAEGVHLYHCRFFNAGEQILKSNSGGSGADDCSIEYSLIEFTNGPSTVDHGGGTDYTGGLHAHKTDRWNIRHNLWRNFHTPDSVSHLFAPVVLMWNNSSETIVEGNTFIDCDRAVALGLIDKSGSTDHHGGIIRNNTVLTNGNSRFSIEVRWGNTGVEFKNNLADAPLNARNGGAYSATGNFLQALPSMFESPATGNLHLLDTSQVRTTVIDRAGSGTNDDFDGNVRSTADIGADEFIATNTPPTATDDDVEVDEDSRLVIAARTNDFDPDGDPITEISFIPAVHGKVSLVGGILSYLPHAAFVGSDVFTYTISDGQGGTGTAGRGWQRYPERRHLV